MFPANHRTRDHGIFHLLLIDITRPSVGHHIARSTLKMVWWPPIVDSTYAFHQNFLKYVIVCLQNPSSILLIYKIRIAKHIKYINETENILLTFKTQWPKCLPGQDFFEIYRELMTDPTNNISNFPYYYFLPFCVRLMYDILRMINDRSSDLTQPLVLVPTAEADRRDVSWVDRVLRVSHACPLYTRNVCCELYSRY